MEMENNKKLLQEKLEQKFLNSLQTLEKITEDKLNLIESMKYDFYDNCYVNFYALGKEKKEPEEVHYIETCPNSKPSDKKDDNSKRPSKVVEDKRAKTPTKLATPIVKTKPKIPNTNETSKTNDKKPSVKVDNNKTENGKNAMSKTDGLKRSATAIPPKKASLPSRKSAPKVPVKIASKTTNKKGANDTKKKAQPQNQPQTNPPNEEPNLAKEQLTQAINKTTIIKQLIPKYLYPVPNQLKGNNTITMLYILTKTSFLNPKEIFSLILSCPLLYNKYNASLLFLIKLKLAALRNQYNELEPIMTSYGDLDSYLSKTFSPSKTAQNSLTFVTKEEEVNLSKKEDLPKEIGLLFQLIYILFDEQFDDSLPPNQLITHFFNHILPKYDVKDTSKYI